MVLLVLMKKKWSFASLKALNTYQNYHYYWIIIIIITDYL